MAFAALRPSFKRRQAVRIYGLRDADPWDWHATTRSRRGDSVIRAHMELPPSSHSPSQSLLHGTHHEVLVCQTALAARRNACSLARWLSRRHAMTAGTMLPLGRSVQPIRPLFAGMNKAVAEDWWIGGRTACLIFRFCCNVYASITGGCQ